MPIVILTLLKICAASLTGTSGEAEGGGFGSEPVPEGGTFGSDPCGWPSGSCVIGGPGGFGAPVAVGIAAGGFVGEGW